MHKHIRQDYDNISIFHEREPKEKLTFGVYCKSIGCHTIGPSEESKPSIQCQHYKNPANGRTLNEYHLVVVTQGGGYLEKRNMPRHKIEQGDIFLIYPGEWHLYFPDMKTGWKQYWIGFEGDRFLTLLNTLDGNHEMNYARLGMNATMEGILGKMMQVAMEKGEDYQVYLTSALIHILGTIHYNLHNQTLAVNPLETKMNTACELIANDLRANSSPEEVAERLGMSYSLFRRMFKIHTGFSPVQYQMEARIKHAEEMLASSGKTITTIARELGFTDTAQFSAFFKKREGMTARDYRNIHRTTKR